MKKQPERTDITRQNLIIAFWKLYEKKSIEKISIKEITDLAGYHRVTFYEYYTDIYDLLNQEETELIIQFKKIINMRVHTQNIDEMLEPIADFYLRNGYRLSLLFGAGGDSTFIDKFKHTLYPTFRLAGDVPDTATFSLIYEFWINGIIMAFCYWYKNKTILPVEDFVQTIRSLLEKGIFNSIDLYKKNETFLS